MWEANDGRDDVARITCRPGTDSIATEATIQNSATTHPQAAVAVGSYHADGKSAFTCVEQVMMLK